jgi:hypothetical protein
VGAAASEVPEPAFLSLDPETVRDLSRATKAGDPAALAFFPALWKDFRPGELTCFLCDEPVEDPPFTEVLPERRHRLRLLGSIYFSGRISFSEVFVTLG